MLLLLLLQDFGNNTLVVPPPTAPESVSCILYYSDVDECMGPTAFKPVPEHYNPDAADRKFSTTVTKAQRPDLYQDEQAVAYRPGTALLYRMDVWHRGTPVLPGATRYTHHLGIRRADATWIQFEQTWARDFAGSQVMKEFVAEMSSSQRNVLGFPPPVSTGTRSRARQSQLCCGLLGYVRCDQWSCAAQGHRYWTAQTIAAVADRYDGIDMRDYAHALGDRTPKL